MFQVIGHPSVEKLYQFNDSGTELRGYIAIHNSKLGPALGGTRCVKYESDMAALRDAIRLSQSMSYKAALAGIAHGGGKAVLLEPDCIKDRKAYFRKYGEYLQKLGGSFITTVDSGTSPIDIEYISLTSEYVTNTSRKIGDPSPYTALGVLLSIKAAIAHKLGKPSLKGVRVAVQGLGHVGEPLARRLKQEGAELIVSDTNQQQAMRIASELDAKYVAPEQIYQQECDVFCPCALGGALNIRSVQQLTCSIIAGAANNQLDSADIPYLLQARGICYVPDYVVNAGGLIAVDEYTNNLGSAESTINKRVGSISALVEQILEQAQQQSLPPALVADQRAEAILGISPIRGDHYAVR